jgi:hypothetical protein
MQVPKLKTITLLAGFGFLAACTKNGNTKTMTVYDTITVTKTDTLKLPPPDDTPNLTSGLVLYLPFNGSFADSSGLNNTVTAVNGAALGYDMHGYAQSAYTSNGGDAYLMVTNNGSYAVDTAFALSFDFMIKADAYYYGGGNYLGLQTFISIVDEADGTSPTFNVGLNVPSAPQDFNFGTNSSTSGCGSSGNANPLNIDTTTNFIPQIGSWYNAIVEDSHGTLTVYINGQLIATKTGGTDSVEFCPTASFVVGAWWNNGGENLNGSLDEVRFYNHTLTPQQIAWLSRNFQINSTGKKPGLQSGKAPGVN